MTFIVTWSNGNDVNHSLTLHQTSQLYFPFALFTTEKNVFLNNLCHFRMACIRSLETETNSNTVRTGAFVGQIQD